MRYGRSVLVAAVLTAALGSSGAWAAQRQSASAATTVDGCPVVANPTREHYTLCRGDLRDASFEHLDLRFAHFIDPNLSGANFNGANLANSYFQKATLKGAHFVDADLIIAFLGVSNAEGADFANANLSGATIARFARLPNFEETNFRNADMVAVQGADNVNWNFADMTGAILAYSQIKPAAINGSATLNDTVCPDLRVSMDDTCPVGPPA